ncbi:L,D-transpeptidase [Allochromatium vinosum]|uniref:ErfK/YbiS/YcfS/YnhG family protein n=1 Tax=Allochromatium vinosum (strain ATCC 17899 / DSM 180 / NBRC 103801 / NCIMB 10441 / D) TaxID=572477 RepID=D3RUS1_ALLVD|nr:L,D-transpeptidase [Allochromatium vinosum]ADC62930.1 ErfK/YbiS/YcfS/YnhG family protein [Allochromatium vinosum DSM 180]
MSAPSTHLLSFLAALSLVGCAHTPSETLTEPEPRETEWRIGGADAGLPADMSQGFIALPVTTGAPIEAEPDASEAVPTKAEAIAAEPSSWPAESATAAPAADADTAKHRSLTISLGEQLFEYKEGESVVRSGPISSGKPGNPTPTGRFKVLSKDEDKVSSRYTNQLGMQAWMPYSIQFYGHYFLHEGWLPGYPDSHGCVRVGEKDARFLFERLRVGDPVLVVN